MSFRPTTYENGGQITARELAVVAAGSWNSGALIVTNASGEATECGADPALIAGISLSNVGTGTGPLYPLGVREFPPGRCTVLPISPDYTFTCQYKGTLGTLGTAYGVVKDTDGLWKVDFSDVGGTTTRVTLVDKSQTAAPLLQNRVSVKFTLTASWAIDPI